MKWTQEEINILIERYPGSNMKDLLLSLPNRTYSQIKDKARYIGIRSNSKGRPKSSYVEKLDSFDKEACYWWGLIMSDGCITDKQIILSLHENDKEQLDKFSNYIGNRVTYRTTINSFHKVPYTMGRVVFNNKPYLNKWNLIFNIRGPKTYYPPNLDVFLTIDKLIYFLIGFIDGDGCISSNGDIIIKIHNSWKDEMIKLFNKFEEFYQIKATINTNTLGFLVIRIGRKYNLQKIKFFTVNLPVLNRKWDKIINNEHTSTIS